MPYKASRKHSSLPLKYEDAADVAAGALPEAVPRGAAAQGGGAALPPPLLAPPRRGGDGVAAHGVARAAGGGLGGAGGCGAGGRAGAHSARLQARPRPLHLDVGAGAGGLRQGAQLDTQEAVNVPDAMRRGMLLQNM